MKGVRIYRLGCIHLAFSQPVRSVDLFEHMKANIALRADTSLSPVLEQKPNALGMALGSLSRKCM